MKILVVSDTHRNIENFKKVVKKTSPLDRVLHLGDAEISQETLQGIARCPLDCVAGNNDFYSSLPKELTITIGKHKAWLVHGHRHGVHYGIDSIVAKARERGVDIVMFGHTHKPCIAIAEDLTAINPGSLAYPRQDDRRPSYIIMEIDRNGEAHYTVNYL